MISPSIPDCSPFLIKVPKRDVIDIYNFLQAEEGMLSVRTVKQDSIGGEYWLKATVSPDFLDDFQLLLRDIQARYPIVISEMSPEEARQFP